MTTVYKVLFRPDGGGPLASSWMEEVCNPGLAVEYRPGEWSAPPPAAAARGYGLLAFGDERTAHVHGGTMTEVWECEAEGAREPAVPRLDPGRVTLASLAGGTAGPGCGQWGRGAVMADRLRPVRRMAPPSLDRGAR